MIKPTERFIDIKIIGGQDTHIEKAYTKLTSYHYTTEIGKTYVANPTDLKVNIMANIREYYKTYIKKRNFEFKLQVKGPNAKLSREITKFNRNLKREITHHNANENNTKRCFNDEKRNYGDEKLKAKTLTSKDISITCNKNNINYMPNEYITYDDIISIIKKNI